MGSLIYGLGGGGSQAAGSSGEIQFNDGLTPNGLTADSNLFWDNTAEQKRLGIQVGTTPQNPLHVSGDTGPTIGVPTSTSATRVIETIDAAPSVSTSLLLKSDLTGSQPAPTQDVGAYNYTANGQTFDYLIQPYITIDSVKYEGTDSSAGSYTDTINDATTTFRNNITWSATSGASGYLLKIQINGGGYTVIKDVGNVTSYIDNAASGIDSITAWPSVYLSNETGPTDPTSFDSATQSDGSGNRVSNGTYTIKFEVKSYRLFQSVKYSSTNAAALAMDFTDGNTAANFTINLSWTSGGGTETGYVYRYSENGGVSWFYVDVGNNTTANDDQPVNDSAAETLWGTTWAGNFPGTSFYFKTYGITSSPNGYVGGIFSSSSTDYSVLIPNDNLGRIIFHNMSSIPVSGFKVLGGAAAAYDKGIVKTADFYDPGYDTWVDGVTVTPNHYGFTGTDLNRTYRIYSYDVSNGITFYSSTYSEVSITNPGSGYYSVTITATVPSGGNGLRILRSINGGAYDRGRTVTGTGAQTFYDDVFDLWASGSATVVTPTTVEQTPVRIDRGSAATTDPAHLSLVSITSGSAAAKLILGYASSHSGTVTEKAAIGYDNSFRLYLWSQGTSYPLWVGNPSDPYIKFSNVETIFNATNSNSDFTVRGQNNAGLFFVDGSEDTVFLGQTSLNASVATAVAIKANSDSDSCLIIERRNTQSADLMQWRNNGATVFGGISSDGKIYLPATGSDTILNLYQGAGGLSINSSSTTINASGTARLKVHTTGATTTGVHQTDALKTGYTSKTANYTLTVNDYAVNCTSGSFDITLPTAVGVSGQIYVVKNSGSGTITMKTTSSQTMDGFSSAGLTLAQYDSYTFMSNGANWIIL